MNKLVRENINDYLPAPSKEEIEKRLDNANLGPNDLLLKSAEIGYFNGVKRALEQGADIHVRDDLALRDASEEGHLDIVKYLIEQGADIHVWGDAPLNLAAGEGYLDIVKYLVEQGADIHTNSPENALTFASEEGHLDVVKYLIEQGTFNSKTINNALYVAKINNHSNVVNYFNKKMKEE